MPLKIFLTILFLFPFVFISISPAEESVLRKTECEEGDVRILSGSRMEENPAKQEIAHEPLRKLENEMRSRVDDISFPVLFSQYITDCMNLNEHKRAKDFFFMLAEENQASPHAMTAKGIVTYGWWAENVLRHGLIKIDEAISLDNKAFFPRLCRATYLSCLPEEFMAAIHEFNTLLVTEKDNSSNLSDVRSNLIRIYGEHGHHDMEEQVNNRLKSSRRRRYKQINYTNIETFGNTMYRSKITRSSYPTMKNINTRERTAPKDNHLNRDLALLEESMERRLDNSSFGDIYTRYVLLTSQYGEAAHAINFFEALAERHPRSPNALAASGTIAYGWRGHLLLQKGLDCIKDAKELDNENFFSRINHATYIAYFPNGFIKSMSELSLLKLTEAGFRQRLSLINSRINLVCSQHGHDRIPAEYREPVINRRF